MTDIWMVGIGAVMIVGGMVWALRNLSSNYPIALMTAGTVLIMVSSAFAHDHNRPGLDGWYQGLKTKLGPCCDGPGKDATYLADKDWETKDGHYRVYIEGEWIDVPDNAVLNEPNLDGRTLVWTYRMNGRPAVRCFIPGSMT